jgi:competence protein ComEA
VNRSKPSGSPRFHWLSKLAIVAVLVAGGYLFFTRGERSGPSGTFTPFRPALPNEVSPRLPGPAAGQPAGRAGVPSFPFAPRPGNGPPGPGLSIPIVRQMAVVDLNAASLAELETLPDITPDYARKIITGRPYKSMEELERAGIPHQLVEKISPPAIIRLTERGSPPVSASKPNKQP